jgi:hypothetical protein
VLQSLGALRRVIDLPIELEVLDPGSRQCVERFLAKARHAGVHRGYLACHRRAWWAVGLRAPAPILATYMARRAPAFVRNPLGARHINIAHGLYPRQELTEAQLTALVDHLCGNVSPGDGRTYAGGLTKFEPREMERLLVPEPQQLLVPEPQQLQEALESGCGARPLEVGSSARRLRPRVAAKSRELAV